MSGQRKKLFVFGPNDRRQAEKMLEALGLAGSVELIDVPPFLPPKDQPVIVEDPRRVKLFRL